MEAHREVVVRNFAEWLKLGMVQPRCSKYTSPLFVFMKMNGGICLVQADLAYKKDSQTSNLFSLQTSGHLLKKKMGHMCKSPLPVKAMTRKTMAKGLS